jgi:hypothetical protein
VVIDLDKPADGRLEGGIRIQVPGYQPEHWPCVKFRGVCGAHGYFASASFVDQEGHGSGETPREAMLAFAKSLRKLADAVEEAAKKETEA